MPTASRPTAPRFGVRALLRVAVCCALCVVVNPGNASAQAESAANDTVTPDAPVPTDGAEPSAVPADSADAATTENGDTSSDAATEEDADAEPGVETDEQAEPDEPADAGTSEPTESGPAENDAEDGTGEDAESIDTDDVPAPTSFDPLDYDAFEPTEDDVAPLRHEPAYIPDAPEEPVQYDIEEARWVSEVGLSAGVFFREDVAPGLLLGLRHRVVQYGPDTERTLGRSTYRQRRMWALVNGTFGIDPGEGLDQLDLRVAVIGSRQETVAADGSEEATTDLSMGQVRLRRMRDLDRDLGVTAAFIAGEGRRTLHVRERVDLGIRAQVSAVGFEHIQYSLPPVAVRFNGVHIAGVGADLEPTFALGDGAARIRYILGGSGSLALGARSGRLFNASFVSLADLEVHSGFGVDFGRRVRRVSWDNIASFRGSIDSIRENPTGWFVTSTLTGRY